MDHGEGSEVVEPPALEEEEQGFDEPEMSQEFKSFSDDSLVENAPEVSEELQRDDSCLISKVALDKLTEADVDKEAFAGGMKTPSETSAEQTLEPEFSDVSEAQGVSEVLDMYEAGEDHTEMAAEDYPTMAASQLEVEDDSSDSNNGRNPLIDLKNADYIKFAQDKIKNLEKQLFDLRAECEELARAGDHFKELTESRGQKLKALESKLEESESLAKEEKKILQESISSKDLRIDTMQEHIENLEQELESRYNRIRVRERDLEGRLEILKKEQTAVAKSKDEMILKLKSQNESLKSDLEKVRAQSQKVTSHLQDKEDALRRTMKALKLSLTMLESQSKD